MKKLLLLAIALMFSISCTQVIGRIGPGAMNVDVDQAEISGDNASFMAKTNGLLSGNEEVSRTWVLNLLGLGSTRAVHETIYSVDHAGRPIINDKVTVYSPGIIGSLRDLWRSDTPAISGIEE